MTKSLQEQQTEIEYFLLKILFIALGTAMYFYNTQYISGGINIMYKVLFAVGIIAVSFIYFMIRTDIPRMVVIIRYSVLLTSPFVFTLIASIPIWINNNTPDVTIRRGVFNQIYEIIVIIAVLCFLYVFGEKGIWINLAAMLIANGLTIVTLIIDNGFAAFWSEFMVMLTTFSVETGDIMNEAEVHDLTFAITIYIMYIACRWKTVKNERFIIPAVLFSVLFFLTGLKRIALISIAAAIILYWVFTVNKRTNLKLWSMILSFALIIFGFVFIYLMRNGLFSYLSDNTDIDTMGRKELAEAFAKYYDISPFFAGHGAGFSERIFLDEGFLELYEASINSVQCDFLLIYMNMGFIGYWIWMLLYLPVKTYYIYQWQGGKGAILSVVYSAFVFVTSTTDNTIYMLYFVAAISILSAGYAFNQEETEQRERMLC